MSYLIVLCVVAVETLSLALLWIGLRVDMPRLVRPLIVGAGLSGAWGSWVLALVLRAPLSMMVLTGSVFAVSSVVLGVAIHIATVEEEARPEGGGGGAPTASPDRPGGGGDDDPPWWPEFQRQLAAYAARRGRERQPVDR